MQTLNSTQSHLLKNLLQESIESTLDLAREEIDVPGSTFDTLDRALVFIEMSASENLTGDSFADCCNLLLADSLANTSLVSSMRAIRKLCFEDQLWLNQLGEKQDMSRVNEFCRSATSGLLRELQESLLKALPSNILTIEVDHKVQRFLA